MAVSDLNAEVRKDLSMFDSRIEKMHADFIKFQREEIYRMPDWEGLGRELLNFSKKRILDRKLSNEMDRLLFKFQNRKKIWMKWLEDRRG